MYSVVDESFCDCGQKFYMINRQKWNELLKVKQLEGISIDNKTFANTIENMIEFCGKHNDFCCGITKVKFGKEKYIWHPFLFYDSGSKRVRVRIETVTCRNCNWKGSIANPTLPDLYETVGDRFAKIKASYENPSVVCPCCGTKLERHAVWAEQKNSNI